MQPLFDRNNLSLVAVYLCRLCLGCDVTGVRVSADHSDKEICTSVIHRTMGFAGLYYFAIIYKNGVPKKCHQASASKDCSEKKLTNVFLYLKVR